MNGQLPSSAEGTAARLAELEEQLREANETLDAIRNGEVDAVVIGGAGGQIVYTLENADRPYRVLVEQMKEGAVTLTGDGIVLYCNQSFAALLGRPIGQITGDRFLDFILERPRAEAMLSGRGGGDTAELTLLTGHGGNPVNISIVELTVEDGATRMLCGIITDLKQNYLRAREVAAANARLEAEIAERTKAEESLAIALEAADMGRWELSLSDDQALRSARHDAIFGYEQMLPRWGLAKALEHFVPEDRAAVRSAFDSAKVTGRVEFERRIVRAGDGAVRWLHVKGRNFSDKGIPDRIAGVVFDVTDRRLIDEQLRQAQKMEAVGQLTGGIAHDFNNLLMIIGGSLEAFSRRTTLDPRSQKLLAAAQQGVARGAKLNAQLLSFARRQDMQVGPVCLNDLLPNFETLLDRAVGETITVKITREPELWYCATDPHQLETAILNLAINARDAMEPGGLLTLSMANEVVRAVKAKSFDAVAGEYVVVAISDTGSGMSPEILARVFEPFYKTKEIGKGTGLGLSQVYGFAKQSGGFVSIESRIGEGTTVSIYLARTEAPDAVQKPSVNSVVAQSCGVVLLVEDDADVRAASSAMLEELGYSVRQTASANDALEALREDSDVDVLFTDVIMSSGMSGVDLAHAVKKEWPHLPVLLTSGYTAQRVIPTAMNGEMHLLHKPYTIYELAQVMRQTIEGIEG